MSITFLGDVCLDLNVVRGEARREVGGGVFHGAVTACRLGARVRVRSKAPPADRPAFAAIADAGAVVEWLDSPFCTSIRNDYPSENPDERVSRVLSLAAPFSLAEVADLSADTLHVNPLWMGMVPPVLLSDLRARCRVLCADAQGFLRRVDPDGQAAHRPWSEAGAFLPLLDVLKVDAVEAAVLTGHRDRAAAAGALRALGVGTVLLTHQDGMLASDGSTTCEAPWTAWTLEGRTGRGDTCTAAFLVGLDRGWPLPDALALAARVTSMKMLYRGPFRGEDPSP